MWARPLYPTLIPTCPQLTQAVEAERPVVQEVANVARTRRHGAKGVRAAGCEGVEADGQEEDQQRKVVRLRAEAGAAQRQEAPQEVPKPGTCSGAGAAVPGQSLLPILASPSEPKPSRSPGGQEMSPDVDCLIGHLEGAEDTV